MKDKKPESERHTETELTGLTRIEENLGVTEDDEEGTYKTSNTTSSPYSGAKGAQDSEFAILSR